MIMIRQQKGFVTLLNPKINRQVGLWLCRTVRCGTAIGPLDVSFIMKQKTEAKKRRRE
jgi:hypothetical protein